MISKSLIGATCTCLAVASFSADAALVGRLAATPGGTDYQAYYDDVANLTWLADAHGDRSFSWAGANSWAAGLTVGGVTGWRLPTTESSVLGTKQTGSEMGNMYVNVLGGFKAPSGATGYNLNINLFSNVLQHGYWSSTERGELQAFVYVMKQDGDQTFGSKTGISAYSAWAVQSGDVSAVPVPAAVWLFGSGLLGLIGVAKRKKA